MTADVVRVGADGSSRVVPFAEQDALDRMLHPLGHLLVIGCVRCGAAAHAMMQADADIGNKVAGFWCCHTCGTVSQVHVTLHGSKLPAACYEALRVKPDTGNSTQ